MISERQLKVRFAMVILTIIVTVVAAGAFGVWLHFLIGERSIPIALIFAITLGDAIGRKLWPILLEPVLGKDFKLASRRDTLRFVLDMDKRWPRG